MREIINRDEKTILQFLYEKNAGGKNDVSAICQGTGLSRQRVRRLLRSLEERQMVSGPPDLLKQTMLMLKDIDPKLETTDPGYPEHVILLASALSRAEEQFLSDELGYDQEFVGIVGSRLRSSGIWTKENKISEKRLEAWNSSTSFWCDGAIATGHMKVVGEKDGDPLLELTEEGKSAAAKLIKTIKK